VTNPLPFIGVTPCRIVDTRGPVGTFGGPSLPAGTPRNFPLPTGPCAGIPASVSAYSLNITVTNTQGPGFILLYPTGGSQPLVSTLNYWIPVQDNEKFFVPESASARLPGYLSEEERGRLIRNGTYNADGTVNMETAERVGWVKAWAERQAQKEAAAVEARKAAGADHR